LKIRQADKVFFQFFEIFLNGRTESIVRAALRFGAFYRISRLLPRKKLNFFWGGFGTFLGPTSATARWGLGGRNRQPLLLRHSERSEGSRNRSREQTKDTARLTDLCEILHFVQDDSARLALRSSRTDPHPRIPNSMRNLRAGSPRRILKSTTPRRIARSPLFELRNLSRVRRKECLGTNNSPTKIKKTVAQRRCEKWRIVTTRIKLKK